MIGETWRGISAEQRRWIVVNSIVATAVVNLMLNALIAWLSVRGDDGGLELWSSKFGESSMVADAIGTALILPLITCLITTALVRREIAAGKLAPIDPAAPRPSWLRSAPQPTLRRAIWFGAWTALIVAPVWVLLLIATGFEGLSPGEFALYKALVAVPLGIVVTPPIAYAAMALPR